jgi:hypothetical protein
MRAWRARGKARVNACSPETGRRPHAAFAVAGAVELPRVAADAGRAIHARWPLCIPAALTFCAGGGPVDV